MNECVKVTGVDPALCTLPYPSIFVRQTRTKASMFVLLRFICVVKCVDDLKLYVDID